MQNHTLTRDEEDFYRDLAHQELMPFEYFRTGAAINEEQAALEEAMESGMSHAEATAHVAKRNNEQVDCTQTPSHPSCSFRKNYKPLDLFNFIDVLAKSVCYYVTLDPCVSNVPATKFFVCGDVKKARDDFMMGTASCGNGNGYSVKCAEQVPGVGVDIERTVCPDNTIAPE
jgi:hypothetical protein